METIPGQARTLMFEEVCYGKPVRTPGGPLHESALYGVNAVTPGIDNPLRYIPANFLGNTNLTSSMIDPEFAGRGALIVKAVDEGLAIMRMRYRAEAGEGESGRQFLLSRTLLLPDIHYWHEIPPGLFSWCEQALVAQPFVFDHPAAPPARQVDLPPFQPRDVNWFDNLSQHRQIQLGSAFQAITRRIGWTVSRMVAEEEKQRPAALIAADLDVMSSLPRKFPLRDGDQDQFILNLGLEPVLTPGAISYFPGHRGSAIEAPDLHALRIAIISSEENKPSEQRVGPSRGASDSLDRRIGSEPIPLKWLS
ncbi:hypothetical protein SAMN05877838_2096 [Hoeflea halophila]|uniref:Uncharacterized protein n=1 Tax=Hoeflea halophila TaxID=714899 RepID=A0A286IAP5_9HYPH|nr:hypothetical protein [Hoeflea halophila]SOE17203.1 hypothetical protein SAMN05877838_2096 [Hoeflea halophila]